MKFMIFTKNVLFKQFLFSSLNTNICLDLAEAYGVYIYCNDLGSIVPPTITTVETIPLFNNYNRVGLKKRNRESLLPPPPPPKPSVDLLLAELWTGEGSVAMETVSISSGTVCQRLLDLVADVSCNSADRKRCNRVKTWDCMPGAGGCRLVQQTIVFVISFIILLMLISYSKSDELLKL